jgi:Phosphodiester glycosidase
MLGIRRRRGLTFIVRAGMLLLAAWLAGCATPPPPPTAWVWQPLHAAVARLDIAPLPHSRVHALRIDLRAPGVRLELSPMHERGQTLDAMASGRGALLSVNVSFFDARFAPLGLTISQGERWQPTMQPQSAPVFACSLTLHCVVKFDAPVIDQPEWTLAMGGRPWLLRAGQPRTTADDAGCASLCAHAHPRTAIGLDRSGRYVYLVLAEGRRAPVLGLTATELAGLMLQLGAFDAINLDGGGSSSLLIDGVSRMARPANEPAQRRLANALHVFVHAAP